MLEGALDGSSQVFDLIQNRSNPVDVFEGASLDDGVDTPQVCIALSAGGKGDRRPLAGGVLGDSDRAAIECSDRVSGRAEGVAPTCFAAVFAAPIAGAAFWRKLLSRFESLVPRPYCLPILPRPPLLMTIPKELAESAMAYWL